MHNHLSDIRGKRIENRMGVVVLEVPHVSMDHHVQEGTNIDCFHSAQNSIRQDPFHVALFHVVSRQTVICLVDLAYRSDWVLVAHSSHRLAPHGNYHGHAISC